MPHAEVVTKRWSKTQMISEIAKNTGLSKKDVGAVLNELDAAIHHHVTEGSVGEFVLPGLLKIKRVEKPARAEREGINPATGERITIAAKPSSWGVRISALKKLKDMV